MGSATAVFVGGLGWVAVDPRAGDEGGQGSVASPIVDIIHSYH